MNLDEIFKHKLLIVSGKGGVGKTTVAATLGLLAAKRGKKTLIAEINSAEKISQIFKLRPIGYQETKLAENLFGINIDPHSAFHEYVLEQIHSSTLYHLVFENNLVKNFLDATPGLNTLLEIGKIWALTERNDKKEKNTKYDLVIVDAPATGHGLALLQVPQIVSAAVRVGPIRTKAESIVHLLKDKKKTVLFIVTLAEEMPVNEAIEMLHQAENKIGIATGPLFVNALFPSILPESEWLEIKNKLERSKKEKPAKIFQKIIHYYQERIGLQHLYLNKLKMEVGDHELFLLPYLFSSNFGDQEIKELASILEARYESG